MLGPFTTTSRLKPIQQMSLHVLSAPPAHRCPRRQRQRQRRRRRRQRQRVTEGTAMASRNGPNYSSSRGFIVGVMDVGSGEGQRGKSPPETQWNMTFKSVDFDAFWQLSTAQYQLITECIHGGKGKGVPNNCSSVLCESTGVPEGKWGSDPQTLPWPRSCKCQQQNQLRRHQALPMVMC